MIRCRSFKQLIVLLGAAILLPSVVTWAQAPRCAVTFTQKSITAAEINTTIQQLAEMKMNLDLAQSRGRLTTAEKRISQAFPTRMQELTEALQGQMSENQVRDLLTVKIKELQNLGAAEEEARTEEAKNLPYLLDKSINAAFSHDNFDGLTYLPQRDSLLFRDNFGLRNVRLDGGNSIIEHNPLKFVLAGDDLIILTRDNQIYRYNVLTGERSKPLKEVESKNSVFAPSGKWFAFEKDSHIEVLNLESGTKLRHQFKALAPPGLLGSLFLPNKFAHLKIYSYRFVNDSEMIILTDSNTIFKFNFITGSTKSINTGSFKASALYLANDIIVLRGEGELASIALDKMETFERDAKILSHGGDFLVSEVDPVDEQSVFVRYRLNGITHNKFLDPRTLEEIQNLPVPAGFKTIYSVAVDKVGQRLFMASYQPDESVTAKIRTQFDIWKKFEKITGADHD